MKVQDMPAGPEMDRLVAEKVMGWKVSHLGRGRCETVNNSGVTYIRYWVPSSEISSAWEVVEHMNRKTGGFMVEDWGDKFFAGFGPADPAGVRRKVATADTAPLAICRAALIAVGAEVTP